MIDAEAGDNRFCPNRIRSTNIWANFGLRAIDAVAIDAISNAGTELDLLTMPLQWIVDPDRINNWKTPNHGVIPRRAGDWY